MLFKLARFARSTAVAILLPLAVGACATASLDPPPVVHKAPAIDPLTAQRYGAIDTEKFPIAAVELDELKPRYVRKLVDYPTSQPPGTMIIDPKDRHLYLVQAGGKALRYGVGVGVAGLEFTGTADIAFKREWPRWTPTKDMIARSPERYQKWAGGMAGGEKNPLGARALYLFKGGKDTLYRIHGTNEPWTIGEAVSSGCIRMMNQDVIDLYNRIPDGSKVVVL